MKNECISAYILIDTHFFLYIISEKPASCLGCFQILILNLIHKS